MKIKNLLLYFGAIVLLLIGSCTNLDENVYDIIIADTFYKTETMLFKDLCVL